MKSIISITIFLYLILFTKNVNNANGLLANKSEHNDLFKLRSKFIFQDVAKIDSQLVVTVPIRTINKLKKIQKKVSEQKKESKELFLAFQELSKDKLISIDSSSTIDTIIVDEIKRGKWLERIFKKIR